MRKDRLHFSLLTAVLVLVVSLASLAVAVAEDKENGDEKDAWKAITITTGDLKTPYEVLGTVAFGDQLTGGIIGDPVLKTIAQCEKEMAKQAAKAGANAIIGVQVELSIASKEAYLLMYGTAVKTAP